MGKFQDQHLVLMMKVREDLDYDLMKWFGFVGCEVMKEFELLEPSLLGLTCSFCNKVLVLVLFIYWENVM